MASRKQFRPCVPPSPRYIMGWHTHTVFVLAAWERSMHGQLLRGLAVHIVNSFIWGCSAPTWLCLMWVARLTQPMDRVPCLLSLALRSWTSLALKRVIYKCIVTTWSMASSKALLSGTSLQEVYDEARWSFPHTFIRFYSLDLPITPGLKSFSWTASHKDKHLSVWWSRYFVPQSVIIGHSVSSCEREHLRLCMSPWLPERGTRCCIPLPFFMHAWERLASAHQKLTLLCWRLPFVASVVCRHTWHSTK